MGELTRLGATVKGLVPGNRTRSSDGTAKSAEPSLEYLASLGATDAIEEIYDEAIAECEHARINSSQFRAEFLAESGGDTTSYSLTAESSRKADQRFVRLTNAVRVLEERLTHARRRDEIAATRPDGCWCLGLGGTGEAWVPGPNGSEDARAVKREYCGCPDGQRLKAVENGIRNAHQKRLDSILPRRTLRLAAVPKKYRDASFDSFPVSDQTRADVDYLRRWAEEFTPEGTSVLLRGDFGTGKTGLAVATMRAVIERHGVDAYFTTVKALLEEIKDTYGQKPTKVVDGIEVPTAKQLQDAFKTVTLIVLDDLGAEGSSDWARTTLFDLINERHNQEKRTVFTSNLGLKELNALHGERLVWRIVEMCGGQGGRNGIRHVVGPNLREPRFEDDR